jgi:hypothetical protein
MGDYEHACLKKGTVGTYQVSLSTGVGLVGRRHPCGGEWDHSVGCHGRVRKRRVNQIASWSWSILGII